MNRWFAEHRAFVVESMFENNESVVATQHLFRQHFNIHRNDSVPAHNTIKFCITNFRQTACATKKKPEGRPCSVRTPENVEQVRCAIMNSPQRSTRKLASALRMTDRTVRRILHHDLHFHLYKLVNVQQLSHEVKIRRVNLSGDILTIVTNGNNHNHLIMTDEANFHLCGYVNTQNCRYWTPADPRELHETPLHSVKVNVWCGIALFGVIGPYFFEDEQGRAVTTNAHRYDMMLQNFVEPELCQCNVEYHNLWFQQDGATVHTANISMVTLRGLFPGRVISRRGDVEWPPRSPDLNACDFFLWDYLKSKVYENRPRTAAD